MDDSLRQRLADKQGNDGGSKFPKYVVPIINFNGNTGEYRRTPVVDGELAKEAEPLKSPVEIVVLKKRSAFASKLDADPSYFSSEFGSPNDSVALFQNMSGRVSFVEASTATALRTKYPAIKTKSVLYCLYDNTVHKLEVKGGSMSNFFEWQDEMKKEDKHSFEVTVKLGSDKKKHETSKKTYYVMTFKSTELADTEGLEEAMDEVNEALKKQDAYQKERNAIAASSAAAVAHFDGVDKPVDESNPDDIPF